MHGDKFLIILLRDTHKMINMRHHSRTKCGKYGSELLTAYGIISKKFDDLSCRSGIFFKSTNIRLKYANIRLKSTNICLEYANI